MKGITDHAEPVPHLIEENVTGIFYAATHIYFAMGSSFIDPSLRCIIHLIKDTVTLYRIGGRDNSFQ